MNLAAHARTLVHQPVAGGATGKGESYAQAAVLVLPLGTRCASLLTLLLQDGAVDLELASSVVALDPGLAFGTLQLANGNRNEGSDPVWQLPMALVAAGREALQQLVQRAPKIEASNPASNRTRLSNLTSGAVMRACVAHLLARELGGCNPRKSYLSGLLLELPALARFASPVASQVQLLATMCGALPAGIIRAAMGTTAEEENRPTDPLAAAALIADAVIRARAEGLPTGAMEELASTPLWHYWNETDTRQRTALLGHCCETAKWASAKLGHMDPWEFMARLERHNVWE
jgi:hypothetical protein